MDEPDPFWSTYDFEKFTEEACGHLLIAIGRGDYRAELVKLLEMAHRIGAERQKRIASERKRDAWIPLPTGG